MGGGGGECYASKLFPYKERVSYLSIFYGLLIIELCVCLQNCYSRNSQQ